MDTPDTSPASERTQGIRERSEAALLHASPDPEPYAELAWASAADVPALLEENAKLRAAFESLRAPHEQTGHSPSRCFYCEETRPCATSRAVAKALG